MTSYPATGRPFRLGILGGGQLGRMLCQAAIPYDVEIHVLDPNPQCPAAEVCHKFTPGSFQDKATVIAFAQDLDALTVEIEDVSTEALKELTAQGLHVAPGPDTLETIRDKGIQKQHYADHQIPTMPFELFQDAAEVRQAIQDSRWQYPFVQKTRTGGYDGQGVTLIRSEEQLNKLFDAPSVLEQLCDIDKEIAVIVARNSQGEILTYDPVEMVFDPEANLIDYLQYPADLSPEVAESCRKIAKQTAESLKIEGLLAVELFLDQTGVVYVNEVAPRPHNSGHQSIESSVTSQYEQHLRIVLGMPLGNTEIKMPSIMLNLVGEPGADGPTMVLGMQECLQIPGVKVHLYGKVDCRANRKMGHVTIVDSDLQRASESLQEVRAKLKITSSNV